jgi:hypothetical protein
LAIDAVLLYELLIEFPIGTYDAVNAYELEMDTFEFVAYEELLTFPEI